MSPDAASDYRNHQISVGAINLEAIADCLRQPVLSANPFPGLVTSQNVSALARFTEWAEASRSKIEADLKRFRNRDHDHPAEDWELAALDHACREWRVFEAFRLLHVQGWCPALLFQLRTKKALLILCDADAGSSKDGFTDRQKQVLSKRGIDSRFRWAAARRMMNMLGVLEPLVLLQAPGSGGVLQPPALDTIDEPMELEASSSAHAGTSISQDVRTEEAEAGVVAVRRSAEQGSSLVDDDPEEVVASDAIPDSSFPPLRLDRVWSALPSYTKAKLEAVYQRMACGLWTQFADRFYSSSKKAEMLAYVQRLVRFHANLEAAQHLSDGQLDAFFNWMQSHLTDRYQREEDLRIAARLFQDLMAMADLDLLSPDAWNQYREAELRRIGAFCYHRFYEQEVGAEQIEA